MCLFWFEEGNGVFLLFSFPDSCKGEGAGRAQGRREREHPAACPSPPTPATGTHTRGHVHPGACPGSGAFSALGSECAEVGSWGQGRGRNEAAQAGTVVRTGPASRFGPYRPGDPAGVCLPLASDPTSWKKLPPAPPGACRDLRKLGMIKVQTAPALASALLAQPLPSLPARVQPHLHLASVEVRATTPFPA